MRVHIYEEELGEGIEIIMKTGVNGNETFYGLRIWLKSCQALLDHSTPEDDCRSAVTIWCHDPKQLYDVGFEIRRAAMIYLGSPSA